MNMFEASFFALERESRRAGDVGTRRDRVEGWDRTYLAPISFRLTPSTHMNEKILLVSSFQSEKRSQQVRLPN